MKEKIYETPDVLIVEFSTRAVLCDSGSHTEIQDPTEGADE